MIVNEYGNLNITPYMWSLMNEGKNFMVFLNNDQVLIGDEIDEWNMIHGHTNEIPRYIFHRITKDKHSNYSGYAVKGTHLFLTLMIPDSVIKENEDSLFNEIEKEIPFC